MAQRHFSRNQISQIAKVAQLYHQSKMTQPEIARRLNLSQAGVSRALKDAERLGIVRTTVHIPEGFFSETELKLEEIYKLTDVVVIETSAPDESALMAALGDAAAACLERALPACRTAGIFPWSETLLYTVKAMRPLNKSGMESVVQVFGGVGQAASQMVGTRLTEQLAQKTGAEPVFLMVPGICRDEDARAAIKNDQSCQLVFDYFDRLDLILLGIGTITPSRYLRDSGNSMTDSEQDELTRLGAVGDLGQNFFTAEGGLVESSFTSRIIGIGYGQLIKVPCRMAVAGGGRKFEAIRGILRGGLLTHLITDLETARRLIQEP
ncbi:DNA-binding transcriptional regulator [Deltaproteobacteria bacterium Smac51]|nr:DNA-binding transcriptional regulator [Deltaproteobacteria bacterium Smac51]